MKTRFFRWIAVVMMMSMMLSAGAAGAETTPPDAAAAESTLPDTQKIKALINDLIETAGELNYDEVLEVIKLVRVLIASEDFQHLITYQEVKDLADMAIMKITLLAMDEPELFAKILATLGVNEGAINILLMIFRYLEESELVGRDDIGAAATEILQKVIENPKLLDQAEELLEEMKSLAEIQVSTESTSEGN